MQFYSTYEEFCAAAGQRVTVTSFVEAEGGYGCAVSRDTGSYDCSAENGCPGRDAGNCPLER